MRGIFRSVRKLLALPDSVEVWPGHVGGSLCGGVGIPARMDRLPWTRWHWLVIFALGFVWILDGLEVTIVGWIGGVLKDKDTLALSSAEVGWLGSIYVAGAVTGAILFGYLTDRFGRKRLFFATLGVYVVATAASGLSWDFVSLSVFRFITGMGIGGEYSAINSAVDELIPARVRGWADLAINGSFWLGAAFGAVGSLLVLDKGLVPADYGWRAAFGIGAALGVVILVTRRLLPESPRWLMTHGRAEEAERIVTGIERRVRHETGEELEEPGEPIQIHERKRIGFLTIAKMMVGSYPRRSLLGFSLMSAQAFFYNAVFFTYAIILTDFFDVSGSRVPLFLIPFALGNFLGPLTIGRLFDAVGRRAMIATTYLAAAAGLLVVAVLFDQGVFSATTLTVAYSLIFFVASAGASSAYLTVSEVFPLEMRAMAIAFFYALATGAGGFAGPAIYGALIGTGDPTALMWGFLAAAVLMAAAGVVEIVFGVDAEQESLEDVATPLSAAENRGDRPPEAGGAASDGQASDRKPKPGTPSAIWSAFSTASAPVGAGRLDLEREVRTIVAAATDAGPVSRDRLAQLVAARRWGPGCFRRALQTALAQGRIRRVGRGLYAAPR